MAKTKQKSVGLIVFTCIPESNEIVAFLQRRGACNFENGFKPESYSGACQVTAHGKLEEDESFIDGIKRETLEELGNFFCRVLDMTPVVRLLGDETRDNKVTYGIFVEFEIIKHIRLEPSSGGLVPIFSHEVPLIHSLKNFNKNLGVNDLNIIAMFPDEIEVLKIGFKTFSNQASCVRG